MIVRFLGTGTSQGVPVISCKCEVCLSGDSHDKRLRSSVLVEVGKTNILIDCGPDFRQQMLREGMEHLEAILLTHDHKDHIAGLDDVRAFNYTSHKPIDIYAEKHVHEGIKREFAYAFGENRYPGVPDIILHTIDERQFKIKNIEVIPIRGRHLKLPVLGFRIGGMCYITDMNEIEDSELDKLQGADVLILNALRIEKHISHFSLSDALKIIEKVAPRRAYLTHMSHQMGLHREMQKRMRENIFLGYDGLVISTE